MTKPTINRTNLKKLAKYLEKLPADYQHFEMREYITGKHGNQAEVHYALHNGGVETCGYAGCAIGHGPAAGILFKEEDLEVNGYLSSGFEVDWNNYCDRYFVDTNTPEWEWLFGGGWHYFDNTPHGAAARIRYFLDHGVPKDAVEQRGGDEYDDDIWYVSKFKPEHVHLYANYLKKGK